MVFRVAVLIWIILSVTVAGVGLTAVLSVPELAAQSEFLIPAVSIAGFVLAMPIAYVIARKITRAMQTA